MQKKTTVELSTFEKNITFLMPLLMMIIDYCAVVCAEYLALLTRSIVPGNIGVFQVPWLIFWVTTPVIFILFLQVQKLYTRRAQFWQLISKIFHGCNYAMLGIIVLMYFAHKAGNTSRLFIAFLWVYSFILITSFRYFSRKILDRFGIMQMPVLLVGGGEKAASVAHSILNDAGMGYKIIGVVSDLKIEHEILKQFPLLGKITQIEKVLQDNQIDTVMICVTDYPQDKFRKLVYTIQPYVKNVDIIPNYVGIPMSGLEVESLFTDKMIILKTKNNLASPLNLFIKTVFDYVLTFFGTIAISPILLLIACWIYKEDPGPIIFKHMRVGKDGKLFPCYKFRSMVVNSQEVLEHLLATDPEAKKEWEANFKLKNDPRVTKIGAFMRKTSIDELPQIFNVLKGEMSLVGPRPIIQKELDTYYKGYERDYLSVKPGITGMWQVSGRSDTDYDERVELDRWYTSNWSIWLDIMILYKTIAVVLLRKGAY